MKSLLRYKMGRPTAEGVWPRVDGVCLVPMFALLAAAMLPLHAVEVRRIASRDAHQGVASDGQHLFAISNHSITRIDEASGRQEVRWVGDPERFRHLNSCIVRKAELVCADSNYPDIPMDSRIERFNAVTLQHLGSLQLGVGYGSLTWADWHDGAWWACYANYDRWGGTPGRDHRATMLVRYDSGWHEVARWRFPQAILDRFAPMSASGGAWGTDGLLYVTGHSRPELYALRVPQGGGTLVPVAIITTATHGQAIGWDRKDERLLWTIDRGMNELVSSRVPAIAHGNYPLCVDRRPLASMRSRARPTLPGVGRRSSCSSWQEKSR